jgi:hypothetical protein
VKSLLPLALLPLLACSAGSNTSQAGGGLSGLGGGGSGGGSPGSGAGMPAAPLATGLSISEIAVFQAVKVDIVQGGVSVPPKAPVIAGRAALVRVYVTLGAGWAPHAINGVLTVTTAGSDHTFTSTLSPSVASSDAAWTSTFNFSVDAASIGTDSSFVVKLEDPTGVAPGDATAQFPTNGTPTALGAVNTDALKISLFPIHFTAGAAGTPATDPTNVAAYQAVVQSMYPTASVVITVEPTLDYAGPIPQASGNGWDQLLNSMIQRRAGDSQPDVYYYAAFAPSPSFNQFCGAGCVAGLSSIPNSPADHAQKTSIGLVYGGDSFDQQATGVTMAHEVGHGHGREHSPTSNGVPGCVQPTGIDPAYPYPEGEIGVWGYDPAAQKMYPPTTWFDIMGYCNNNWISDYTYGAIAHWMLLDAGADIIGTSNPKVYRQILVHGDGSVTVGESFPVYGMVSGPEHTVTYQDGDKTYTVTGHYYPYDHIPGGYLLAPEPPHFTAVSVPDFQRATGTPAH